MTQNPNDTEEMIWHFICNARQRDKTVGAARALAAARAELLQPRRRGGKPTGRLHRNFNAKETSERFLVLSAPTGDARRENTRNRQHNLSPMWV